METLWFRVTLQLGDTIEVKTTGSIAPSGLCKYGFGFLDAFTDLTIFVQHLLTVLLKQKSLLLYIKGVYQAKSNYALTSGAYSVYYSTRLWR